jgi:membrane-associated phospholipid phosphatase
MKIPPPYPLTCHRVHRGVGIVAAFSASLIGISTLYTKQHYILDVVAGILLACVAFIVFFRKYSRQEIPALDRRLAQVVALGTIGFVGLVFAGFWVAYQWSGEP